MEKDRIEYRGGKPCPLRIYRAFAVGRKAPEAGTHRSGNCQRCAQPRQGPSGGIYRGGEGRCFDRRK